MEFPHKIGIYRAEMSRAGTDRSAEGPFLEHIEDSPAIVIPDGRNGPAELSLVIAGPNSTRGPILNRYNTGESIGYNVYLPADRHNTIQQAEADGGVFILNPSDGENPFNRAIPDMNQIQMWRRYRTNVLNVISLRPMLHLIIEIRSNRVVGKPDV